jgi:hypothetical protein
MNISRWFGMMGGVSHTPGIMRWKIEPLYVCFTSVVLPSAMARKFAAVFGTTSVDIAI